MPATNELLQEGRYRINQEFPQNGNGTVYDAYDTVRDTNVVVKEIPVNLRKVSTSSQQEILKIAFTEQAKILTEITHDSLLNVYDYFSEIDRQYVVMESVDGDDLRVLMERNKSAFPVSDITAWADQLLDALNYLHTYKLPIIHRNIRPGNIKLDSLGKIKLLTFGLVDPSDIMLDTAFGDDADSRTINYAPLEQIWIGLDAASRKVITNKYDERSERILNEALDARSDIYSLGATLYYLVTARQPVDALERVIEILDGKPDPLRSPDKIDSTISPEVSDVLMKAMEIKREYRFDSAAIMRQVLRTALVRVAEREADEAREQEKAAEVVRLAEQERIDQAALLAEQMRLEAEREKLSETDLVKQKLQDAEAQRLIAEKRAAEAEKRLQETSKKSVGKHPDATSASPSDDLRILPPTEEIEAEMPLILPVDLFERKSLSEETKENSKSAIRENVEMKSSAQVELESSKDIEIESSEVVKIESPKNVETEIIKTETSGVGGTGNVELIEVADANADIIPAELHTPSELPNAGLNTELSSYSSVLFEDHAAEADESKGSSFNLPVIAIGVAVLCIAVIGIWMFAASGSKEPVKSIPTTPRFTLEPVKTEIPAPAPVAGTEPTDQTANSLTITSTQFASPAPQRVQQAAKIKKPPAAAAKTPAQPKKAITADDLINDN